MPPMLKQPLLSHIKLHIAVVLFGFTAIHGRLISLDAGIIVWYRMLLASLGFLFIPSLYQALRKTNRKTRIHISLTGLIVMFHWVTFFGAIKASNVSITLCFISTQSFFTAIIEPLFFKRKPDPREIGLSLLIIPGIYLVYQFSEGYVVGILLAICSAILAAIFASLNKKFASSTPGTVISFLELSTGWLGLTLLLPLYLWWQPESTLVINHWPDFRNLLILAILCTTVAYRLSVDALKHVSAFTSAMAINLEPIYGIILAALYFNEHENLDQGFYAGAILIVLAIFLNSILKYLIRRKKVGKPTD